MSTTTDSGSTTGSCSDAGMERNHDLSLVCGVSWVSRLVSANGWLLDLEGLVSFAFGGTDGFSGLAVFAAKGILASPK